MRIRLINPPKVVIEHDLPTTQIYQPRGIAYVAAMLECHGHEVHVQDALALGWKDNPQHRRTIHEHPTPIVPCVSYCLNCGKERPNDS